MSERSKVDHQGLAQSVNTKAITTEYQKTNNPINALFVELLKTILDENRQHFDNSSQSNDSNEEGTIGYIIDFHSGNMPQILTPKSKTEALKNLYAKQFFSWINGDHKSSIPYDRSKLIDFLLYFNYAEYQGSYKYNRKKIDAALAKFGYSPLYLMNYQEFCVLSALKLAKGGEDIYTVFGSLYNNSDFREMIETPDTERGVEDFEKFTNQIEFDFDKVTRLGSKADIDVPANGKKELSLYKFVDLYRHAFGRARLSSYRLFCALILGGRISNELWSSSWTSDSIKKDELLVTNKLHSKPFLKYFFFESCKSTYMEFLKKYRDNLVKKVIQDYNLELNYAKQRNPKTTIFDLYGTTNICMRFLKLKYEDILTAPEAKKEIKKCLNILKKEAGMSSLIYEYKKLWHEECETFFFAKIKGESDESAYGGCNEKSLNVDTKLIPYFKREESITREGLIWAMILCLRSDVLKGLIAGRMSAEDAKSVSNKILRRINKILESVGMLPLNAVWGKHDYLLINAIRHTDYKKLYYSDTIYYPYRNYVFEEIFANMTTDQKFKEIDKIENELLAY